MKTLIKYLFLIIFFFYFTMSFAAENDNSHWELHNDNSIKTINHSAWENFLTNYIVIAGDNHLVKYSKITSQDHQALKNYLTQLSNVPISQYNRNEQLAYWINLYNALTVNTILDHYPVKSIKDVHLSGLFHEGPWDAKLIKVENTPLSLNDIEHHIIRPLWHDRRTHYALNCASMGCPNLLTTAFTAENLNRNLNIAALIFVNSPKGLMIENNQLKVSKIYVWYKEDFGGNDQEVINHLTKYATFKLKEKLNNFHQISGSFYNWSLNEAL